MHELSIVMGIVEIAGECTDREQASVVEEIVLDIGVLTTVDMDAFEFAWKQAVRNTVLAQSRKVVNRLPGRALCLTCDQEFELQHVYDPCPACGGHMITVTGGKELRVKSLVVQ